MPSPLHDGEYRTSAAPPTPVPTPEELDLVILETTHEPMRAHLVRGLLESAGIVVATPGLEHRAMMGAIAGHVSIAIRVPRKDLRKAKRVLVAHDAETPVYDRERRWRIAGFAAMAVPFGGGHLYAGAYGSAAVFVIAQILAVSGVVAGVLFAPLFVVALVLCDLFGSREACARANAGEKVVSGWLSRGALAAFLVVVLGLAPAHGFAPQVLAGDAGRAVCAVLVRCTETDEVSCLRDFAHHRIEGLHGTEATRNCVRCLDVHADASCHEVFASCDPVCGWD